MCLLNGQEFFDSSTDDTVYIDFGTIKKEGKKVKIWSLNAYKTKTQIPDTGFYFYHK